MRFGIIAALCCTALCAAAPSVAATPRAPGLARISASSADKLVSDTWMHASRAADLQIAMFRLPPVHLSTVGDRPADGA